jgi:hypothetical protein
MHRSIQELWFCFIWFSMNSPKDSASGLVAYKEASSMINSKLLDMKMRFNRKELQEIQKIASHDEAMLMIKQLL